MTMKTAQLTRCLTLSALATALLGINLAPVQGQSTATAPGEDPFVSNDVDPSKQGLGGGFDPMSLIHNANLSRTRNGADFAEDTQRNINKAADQFKQLQQQRLMEMQQQQTDPAIAPVPGSP